MSTRITAPPPGPGTSHPPNPNSASPINPSNSVPAATARPGQTAGAGPSSPSRPTVSHQAAPPIIASASHTTSHVLPRRFLGPRPEAVANSLEAEETHARIRMLRRAAIEQIAGAHRRGSKVLDERRRSVVRGITVRVKRGKRAGRGHAMVGDEEEGEDVKLELEDSEDDLWGEPSAAPAWTKSQAKGRKKEKKRRKDVWVGESFDIGREFLPPSAIREIQRTESVSKATGVEQIDPLDTGSSNRITTPPTDTHLDGVVAEPDALTATENAAAQAKGLERPKGSRQTTQESFVTARTQFSDAVSTFADVGGQSMEPPVSEQRETEAAPVSGGSQEGYRVSVETQESSGPPSHLVAPQSQTSSLQPLVPESTAAASTTPAKSSRLSLSPKSWGKQKAATLPNGLGGGKSIKSTPVHTADFRSRLKSAIRKPSTSAHTMQEFDKTVKPKTVQFPVDLEEHIQTAGEGESATAPALPLKGNKAPVDPEEVLSREGGAAEGTSAGAVEEALDPGGGEGEADLKPGDVIMRDRMLVKVGYHREESLKGYDENVQRRRPCSKMEPMEEFVVVWRQGSVEFYQNWSSSLTEMVKAYKRLAFYAPLVPSRTTLSIYNDADMTLCLTTSAGPLSMDVDQYLRSTTTRSGAMRDRVMQSKQAKWIRGGQKGTHVFIMKIAERSRAMDWYWELWRELGGELPTRLDIMVPSLSTSVRLSLPSSDEEDMVGSKETCRAFNAANTIKTSYAMISAAVDLDDLIAQRSDNGADLDLELAWKSIDGNLDWVCWDRTVQDRPRDWALLAGVAKMEKDKRPRTLQLRPAVHRARTIRLENGTMLVEPPGLEGYLVRHTGGAKAKEHVYLSTHDGYIFLSYKKDGHPPLEPKKEGSTPADLFPVVHKIYLEAEHRRMASFLEHTTGCVDLRDVLSLDLYPAYVEQANAPSESGAPDPIKGLRLKRPEACFVVRLAHHSVPSVFETRSEEVAAEWVERLAALVEYWKRRHRVDARARMDAMELQAHEDPFAGTELSRGSDAMLGDVWDWCVIKGCRAATMMGRLFIRKGKWTKFRSRMMVLAGGCLVAFKVKAGEAFHERKQRYPLFGAYVYSGLLAIEELHESGREDAFASQSRVYQDGLQCSDGLEDRTFCVRLAARPASWGKDRTQPWEKMERKQRVGLSTAAPFLLIFRARSKLERDRWMWAINAEMERQVRDNVRVEEQHRNYGKVP